MLDIPARISEWLLLLVKSQRSIAYLLINNELVLIKAGGELDYYGLSDLQHQHSASNQLPFLEGLLPLEETPFLLQSVGMPSGRVADVHFFADEDMTWVVLLDVTSEHDDARKIQQKAYDMTLLSQREARLIAKLEAAHKELTLAHRCRLGPESRVMRFCGSTLGCSRNCAMPSAMFLRSCRRLSWSPSQLTGSSFLPLNWEEIHSVITGLTLSTSPSTCWTSAATASAPRCSPSPPPIPSAPAPC